MARDYDDDDDDEGPGFLTTLLLIGAVGGGGWLLYKMLTSPAQAATTTTATTGETGLLQTAAKAIESIPQDFAPVGIRNNNPGNIMYNPVNQWTGQTGFDANGFCVFDNPTDGVRAIFKLLQSYQASFSTAGIPFTINNLSTRWTATQQSDWAANVEAVSGYSGDQVLDATDYDMIAPVVTGIIVAENGSAYYTTYAGVMASAFAAV